MCGRHGCHGCCGCHDCHVATSQALHIPCEGQRAQGLGLDTVKVKANWTCTSCTKNQLRISESQKAESSTKRPQKRDWLDKPCTLFTKKTCHHVYTLTGGVLVFALLVPRHALSTNFARARADITAWPGASFWLGEGRLLGFWLVCWLSVEVFRTLAFQLNSHRHVILVHLSVLCRNIRHILLIIMAFGVLHSALTEST